MPFVQRPPRFSVRPRLTRCCATSYRRAQVCPDAFRVTRLKVGRRFCVLGRISHEIGWKQQEVVQRLEAKRKAEATVYYEAKKAEAAKLTKAKEATSGPFDTTLAKFGY